MFFQMHHKEKKDRLQLTKTRALSQNVTNAPEGALTPKLKNVEVTDQNNFF